VLEHLFLDAAVRVGLNVLVAGSTQAGKATSRQATRSTRSPGSAACRYASQHDVATETAAAAVRPQGLSLL